VIGLTAVLAAGVKINEARRWFSLGPVAVQPSEFAKLSVIIVNAAIISLKGYDINRFTHLLGLVFLNAIIFLLIVVEPDLGAAVILVPIVAAMVFCAGLKFRWIIICALLLGTTVWAGYPLLKDYQKARFETFLHPEKDPANRGWNAMQSQLAVGSGGLAGKGFMQGTQNTLGFLPRTVSNTDFIFSVIAEETGFIGASSVILLYVLLVSSIIRTAIITTDSFGRYIAAGTATMFFMHSFVNIGMTMRLLPVKGLPLPLISYGGSFMVISLVLLGIIQSVYRNREQEQNQA
jgi:rod shape determining protein RodA